MDFYSKSENRVKALIVDDEEDIGIMTKAILKNRGIAADDVNNLSRAREKVNDNDYDIFFIDLNLSDGNGFELISQLKQKNNEANIVIISAYDGRDELAKARELGVSIFLKKPFTKMEIYRVVEQTIGK